MTIYFTSEDIKYACGCQTPTNFTVLVKTLVFNIAIKYSPYSISEDIASIIPRYNMTIYSISADIEYACGCQTPTKNRISIVMPSEPGKSELNPLLYFNNI